MIGGFGRSTCLTDEDEIDKVPAALMTRLRTIVVSTAALGHSHLRIYGWRSANVMSGEESEIAHSNFTIMTNFKARLCSRVHGSTTSQFKSLYG